VTGSGSQAMIAMIKIKSVSLVLGLTHDRISPISLILSLIKDEGGWRLVSPGRWEWVGPGYRELSAGPGCQPDRDASGSRQGCRCRPHGTTRISTVDHKHFRALRPPRGGQHSRRYPLTRVLGHALTRPPAARVRAFAGRRPTLYDHRRPWGGGD